MLGYYVERTDLQDIDAVITQISALPPETAVMVDVKGIKGDFYYSSAISSKRNSSIDTGKMDELLSYLKRTGRYAIARIPALRDYDYGLNHVPNGVHHSSGGYLYMDDDGCYWLHPGSQGTLSYLTQIIMELKGLGFDEVVLTDFQGAVGEIEPQCVGCTIGRSGEGNAFSHPIGGFRKGDAGFRRRGGCRYGGRKPSDARTRPSVKPAA